MSGAVVLEYGACNGEKERKGGGSIEEVKRVLLHCLRMCKPPL